MRKQAKLPIGGGRRGISWLLPRNDKSPILLNDCCKIKILDPKDAELSAGLKRPGIDLLVRCSERLFVQRS